ncbi:hypothetical protein M407DRAFT_244442, partial [Tulasnella calospora MUT 4182]
DGKVHIDSTFSRLLGKPPIMVAGMTSTTIKAGFVSAVLSAGYHVELAGGGYYNPKALPAKVAEIQAKIPTCVGITLNALYINQRPEGFCVAAGIQVPKKQPKSSIYERRRSRKRSSPTIVRVLRFSSDQVQIL